MQDKVSSDKMKKTSELRKMQWHLVTNQTIKVNILNNSINNSNFLIERLEWKSDVLQDQQFNSRLRVIFNKRLRGVYAKQRLLVEAKRILNFFSRFSPRHLSLLSN